MWDLWSPPCTVSLTRDIYILRNRCALYSAHWTHCRVHSLSLSLLIRVFSLHFLNCFNLPGGGSYLGMIWFLLPFKNCLHKMLLKPMLEISCMSWNKSRVSTVCDWQFFFCLFFFYRCYQYSFKKWTGFNWKFSLTTEETRNGLAYLTPKKNWKRMYREVWVGCLVIFFYYAITGNSIATAQIPLCLWWDMVGFWWMANTTGIRSFTIPLFLFVSWNILLTLSIRHLAQCL